MVERTRDSLDAVFAALADPTRREILTRLGEGEASVTELAEPFEMSLAAVSKHLGVLEEAGLLSRQKSGRVRNCRLITEPMQPALRWIAESGQFWEDSFDSLDRYLAQSQSEGER